MAPRHQQGSSLIGIVVGIGVSVVLFQILSSMVSQTSREVRALRDDSTMRDLRNFVLIRVDCGETKGRSPCLPNMPLYGRNGVLVASGDGLGLGIHSIKGSCKDGRITVSVREGLAKDTKWRPLFEESTWTCLIK